jgi:TM2 domain-containing membrane protein YozV
MDQQLFLLLRDLQPEEVATIKHLTKDMTDTQQKQFIGFYSSKRREPQTMLIVTILGFFCVAGIQRFMLGQIGMGILYVFTGGLCLIGTIVDLVNIKKMTNDYNQQQAIEVANMIQMIG